MNLEALVNPSSSLSLLMVSEEVLGYGSAVAMRGGSLGCVSIGQISSTLNARTQDFLLPLEPINAIHFKPQWS